MNLISKLILVIQSIYNYPQAVFDRLGLIDGEIKYRLKNGVSFYARAGTEDLSEIAVVASGTEYIFTNIKIPKNPVIVDLGAHIGSFSIPAAKKYKDKCKIYSFEANEDNFRLLSKNIKLNNVKSIVAANIAISDYNGIGFLKTKNLNTDAYYLDKNSKKSNCRVNTIPSALGKAGVKKVDVLKMDIEGAEENIFKHSDSNNYIKRNVKYIFIEVDVDYEVTEMKEVIEKNFEKINRNKNVITYKNKYL